MKPYKIKKGLINKKTKNKTTIFDAENSHLVTLNKTASYIFDLLKQGLKEEMIVKKIKEDFKTGNADVSSDVKQTVDQLIKLGIIAS